LEFFKNHELLAFAESYGGQAADDTDEKRTTKTEGKQGNEEPIFVLVFC
jgi:hypothetical protein